MDWHAVHYAKVILDEIFGADRFVNEVIWTYKSGGASGRRFSRKHDNLLFYSKGPKYFFSPLQEKSYNRDYKPYRFKGVKEYRDQVGWYTMVNKKDVWNIDMVGRTSGERTGYATQKPEALIESILESCTREGDLCGDFFGGSGTFAAVAESMNRPWVSCDLGAYASIESQLRLVNMGSSMEIYTEGEAENNLEPFLEVSLTIAEETAKIIFQSYVPDFNGLNLSPEDLDFIKSLTSREALRLIAYYSVDFNYNGHIHRPQVIVTNKRGIMDYKVAGKWKKGQAISIRVLDVFGGSVLKVTDSNGVLL